jgi:hypothetical protein
MGNKHTMVSQDNSFEVTLFCSHIRDKWLNIPAPHRHQFSDTNMASILLETDKGLIQTTLRLHLTRKHNLQGAGLTYWFKSHPELKVGDKLLVTVTKEKNKYRLEIVK